MKPRILNTIFFIFLCSTITFNSLFGQVLSRQEYRSQVRQAIDEGNTNRVQQLCKNQQGEAMRFIEALLDSSVLKNARNEIEGGLHEWTVAKQLADIYFSLFRDKYYFQRALRYKKITPTALKNKSKIINLKNQGTQAFYQGDFQSALDKYQQALRLAESIEDVDNEAAILGAVGAAQFYLGKFETALEYYQKSLILLEKLGDQRRIGNSLGNIASVYSDKSDYPTALANYDKALAIRKVLDDKRGQAADLNNMGLVHEEMGQYSKALEQYEAALALNRIIDNKRSMGKNLANIANVHINLGDYLEAEQIYEEALALRKEQGDRKGEGNDLGNLGIIYQELGDYPIAMRLFQQALTIHRELGFQEGEAYQLGRLADLYNLKGNYAIAVKMFQEALEIHRAMGHVRGQATWLEALGVTYTAVGDFKRALDTFQSALELHQGISNRSGEAATLGKIGRTYLELEDIERAKSYFEQALNLYKELGEKWGECVYLGNLGYVLSLEADSSRAITTWEEAVHLAQELGLQRLQAWLQLQLGDFYRDYGNMNKAAKAYEQGLAISEGLPDPEVRWNLYFGRGQLWESQGDYDRAFYSYQAAIKIIEEIRGKAVAEEMKAGVIHNRFDSYEAIISVLLNLGRVEEALEYVERARSRNLLDLLGNTKIIGGDSTSQQLIQKEQALRAKISKLHSQISEDTNHGQGQVRGTTREVNVSSLQKTQREYQQLLLDLKLRNPEYASMINVVPLSSSQIQKLFDKETVLLEYFVTDDKTLIFVVTNDAVRVLTVPAGKASLRGKIVLFRGTAVRQMDEKKLSEMHWLPPLQRLYEILIEPVQKAGYLSSKKHLLIVPQGMLHYLPFQALVMRTKSESGEILRPHFLIEDYAVSYAPSASALKFCQKKNTASLGKLFLLAPRTSALPSSEEEVVGIALSFGSGVEYLLRDSATESIVKKRGRQFDVLHFATTARFNKANPLFSRLELAGSENDDGNLEVHEVFGLDLHANLVTLSACQTALGSGYSEEHPHGDDLVSLTRAFQYAGTPSVVASLWEVSDPSTAAFMQKFYGYLKKLNKVQALAQTQRDMITGKIFDKTKKNQNKYSHPYFWAPFVLVGDWK